jgi:hypothetical protein
MKCLVALSELTEGAAAFELMCMDVLFSPEVEAKLNRAAAEQGRNAESLLQEAVERLLNYNEWFARQGKKACPPPSAASSSNTTTSRN